MAELDSRANLSYDYLTIDVPSSIGSA
jgi:hypothetical protein